MPFMYYSYDSHLLLRALLRRNIELDPILNGQQILRLQIVDLNISVIDSFRYISMALDAFPSRFPQTLTGDSKGNFSHSCSFIRCS